MTNQDASQLPNVAIKYGHIGVPYVQAFYVPSPAAGPACGWGSAAFAAKPGESAEVARPEMHTRNRRFLHGVGVGLLLL